MALNHRFQDTMMDGKGNYWIIDFYGMSIKLVLFYPLKFVNYTFMGTFFKVS